jgi:hypothetical protein
MNQFILNVLMSSGKDRCMLLIKSAELADRFEKKGRKHEADEIRKAIDAALDCCMKEAA